MADLNQPEQTSLVEGRLNPGLGVEHLEAALTAVKQAFGEHWLLGKQEHVVRILWRRSDFLATNELFWLGDSILRLSGDKRWLDKTIERIKSPSRNERIGFVFELLAIAAFVVPGQ